MYLLPRAPDGEIVAGLCLRIYDIKELMVDEEFVAYEVFIG